MHVGHLTARETVNQLAVAVYPALVDEVAERRLADGLDRHFEGLAALRFAHGDAYGLAGLAVEHPVIVLASLDGVAVNLFDDAARGDTRFLDGKGTALDDFLHFEPITVIGRVEEQAEAGGLQRCTVWIEACSRVRAVQLTQHLAEHILEIVVVVDVRQETLVNLAIAFPVDTMNLRVVELVGHLTPYMIEQILTFLVGLPCKGSLETDGLRLALGKVEFLDASRHEEQVLETFVGFHITTSYTLHDEFCLFFSHGVAPEVIAVLESHLIV